MVAEATLALIFLPMLAATIAVVSGPRFVRKIAWFTLLSLPLLLVPITAHVLTEGSWQYELAGVAAPVGIELFIDGLALVMLWLVAIVGGLVGCHALIEQRNDLELSRGYWPLWLMLLLGLNGVFMSSDLFNIFLMLEVLTLAAVPLVALAGGAAPVRAAMRYLLMAMLASFVFLIGVALLYHSTGSIDLRIVGSRLQPGTGANVAFSLLVGSLLLKGAIFPLHFWLPGAHASAPGPVSAMLSALVVKASLYVIFRVWFETGYGLDLEAAGLFLGLVGGSAILYGSTGALLQARLKMVVAYSTVAQLGYLMLIFPLASALAWGAVIYQLIAHAFAKASLFLAVAAIQKAEGSDRLADMGGLARRQPIATLTLALAGISITGLPISGGFLAKWMLLEAAWTRQGWFWIGLVLVGSLLAAAYMSRVLVHALGAPHEANTVPVNRIAGLQSAPALILALLALLAGLASAPILVLLGEPLPGLTGVVP